jgi:hypothetical protein
MGRNGAQPIVDRGVGITRVSPAGSVYETSGYLQCLSSVRKHDGCNNSSKRANQTYTSRLNIRPGLGARQQYTWKNERGFLALPKDLKHQEVTIYVRPTSLDTGRFSKEPQVAIKIRGGAHSSQRPDDASCTMFIIRGRSVEFSKELIHPKYDSVHVATLSEPAVVLNQWLGLKVISRPSPSRPGAILNQLYLDTGGLKGDGKPSNNWTLAGEYTDVEGVRLDGKGPTHVVDWGGWQTTVRMDFIKSYQFSRLSAFEAK